jgi:hypothetical protein
MSDSNPAESEQNDPLSNIPPGAFGADPEKYIEFGHFVNVTKYRSAVVLTTLGLMAAVIGLIYLSFHLPKDGFGQELSIVLASGIATFLGTPIIVKLSSNRRGYVLPVVLLMSFACVWLATGKQGVIRLLVALEVILHRFLKSVRDRYQLAEHALSQKANELDEREKQFDFRSGGHGFGAPDQFEEQPKEPKNSEKK